MDAEPGQRPSVLAEAPMSLATDWVIAGSFIGTMVLVGFALPRLRTRWVTWRLSRDAARMSR